MAQERQRALQEQHQYFIFPHRLADGRIRTVEVRSSPFLFKNQPALFSIIHDITERKQAEAERLDMERKLLQTQKLESLGILAGGIAHDFNNMLNKVSPYY